ncbi:MFS transporter [Polymorphum gilvum]|uniref:Permease of the Major Facilitator Family n=1 Tax=Polymorphum gilvum (strain LMG 25793 / CGMCC 1.9160 / SL003B-26A1) TaxID=991905 RepID=F2J699_POLGS|nr:MFS transporter [Polymorphum gilvum]ADZ71272.1 Permease of the Major Facilitator Family [Polymorphum gilvum SL003B-26A1]
MAIAAGQTRVVLALGTAQTLAWGSTFYLPAILAVPMARDLGVSSGFVFAAFSAALVVSAFVGPGAGRRIDRLGGRDVLALANLVFAAGLALLGTAQGPILLVGAWLVIGFGMAIGLYEAAFATLAGIYGTKARGAITGITLLAGFASTVCWPISAVLEAEFGWRTACFAWAAAHLLVGLPLNRLLVPAGRHALPDKAAETGAPAPDALAGPPARAFTGAFTGAFTEAFAGLRDRAMILLAVVFTATWFISTAMAAHLPRLLQDAGATPAAAIAAAALVGPAQVAGRLVEFGLLRRVHPLVSARLAALAHPLGAAALLVFGAPAAAVFALVHGAGNGILTIAKGTLPLSLFGAAGYGARQGVLMVPTRLGQAAAPFAFALLMERFGATSLLVSAVIGLCGVAALLALGTTQAGRSD